MTAAQRTQLVALLTRTREHAQRGIIVPLRLACSELAPNECITRMAKGALEDARMHAADAKPTMEQYIASIEVALLRVEEREYP